MFVRRGGLFSRVRSTTYNARGAPVTSCASVACYVRREDKPEEGSRRHVRTELRVSADCKHLRTAEAPRGCQERRQFPSRKGDPFSTRPPHIRLAIKPKRRTPSCTHGSCSSFPAWKRRTRKRSPYQHRTTQTFDSWYVSARASSRWLRFC